jgi:hypothetical protein
LLALLAGTGSAAAQEAKILAFDGAAGDQFGHSVAVSGDAFVIGAYLDDDHVENSWSAYVFDANALPQPTAADAGPDQVVTADGFAQAAVTLAGSGTGFGGVTYEWLTGGITSSTLGTALTLLLTLGVGAYTFDFRVTNALSVSATDSVIVSVAVPGSTGSVGATGAQGPTGATGARGLQGTQGATGDGGEDGADGVDGTNGTNGTNGVGGATGATGVGVPGAQGEGLFPGSMLILPAGAPAPAGYSLVGSYEFDPLRGRASTKSSSKSTKGRGTPRLAVDVYIRN